MRLANAPLVHVLAQVVFSPVPKFADTLPELQARLSALDFPWLQVGSTQQITFGVNAPPKIEVQPRWDFLNPDRTTGVVLTDTSLVLQTTRYTSAQPFRQRLADVVRAVHDVAGPRLVERLGLRYIDLVCTDEGESFEAYVHPGVLGFPFGGLGYPPTARQGLATNATAGTPVGLLVVRSSVVPPNQPVPADLLPTPLRYPPSAMSPRPALALDFDHFAQFATPFPFATDAIISYMQQLRNASHAAFEAVGTAHAFTRWGPWIQEEATT
ncbi:hypothetical protein tb265_06850 [Gemmatimonadetes bacterium T265]|nr:hypothetical protein tb265_06850 [Gemmatimonadetes bacterium T265]